MKDIKVSIIMPVYNVEKYLRQALDSCLEQSIEKKEIICIDDGSTDGSLSILEDYADRFDNLVIIKQSNLGSGPARNRGIECARGKYLCFIDSDDYYASKDVLEKLYLAAERENALICGGNFAVDIEGEIKENQDYKFLSEKRWNYEELQECYYYWKYLYNAQLIKENEIRFPAYRRFQDPPFFVRAMLCAKWFYSIKDTVNIYRIGYKEVNYNLETVIDLLNGIRELFIIAQENQLQKLYDNKLKGFLEEYKNPIWGFAYQQDEAVWDLIRELNQLNEFWAGKDAKPLLTEKEVKNYMESCKNELKKIQQGNNKRPVIIYGAGCIGKSAKESLEKIFPNIIGYAVTETIEKEYIGKYAVKAIQEYLEWKESGLVVIATGVKYKEEIEEHLHKLGFMNIVSGDFKKIKFVQRFLE